MPAYKAYPKVKDQPKRDARKHARKEIFWYNKTLLRKARRQRRLDLKNAVTVEEESTEE